MSTLYLLLGNNEIAFVEGASQEFLTDEQILIERIRLGAQVDFIVNSIIPVENGTMLNLNVGRDEFVSLSKVS
jgi:hypothetical protein